MADPLSTQAFQALIERAQQGDNDALQEICCRYQGRIFAAARLRLGAGLRRRLESCDIVQEVMQAVIDALRAEGTVDFRSERAFLHYLNRVVENRICDEADRWGAQRRDINREVSLNAARSSGSAIPLNTPEGRAAPTPSKIISLQEDLALLEQAMDILPEDQRELIVAVKLEGRTYREVAEETGTTEDGVRMRARRAVLALTRAYKNLQREA